MLDNVLRHFHSHHRGMRKAVISANGALTLQVARSLKRVGLIWGSDIGLLGFDELEWAELAGVGITTLKQPTGRLASPPSSRWCVGLKAATTRSANGCFPAS